MLKKTGQSSLNQSKRKSVVSAHSVTSSKRSQRISRYSNVNIAMLNSMKSNETNIGEEIELNMTKPTKIEQKVTLLTIKRTMTCFFLIIFSIPFFIETTYKSYLSEFQQLADLANSYVVQNNTSGYLKTMNLLVSNHVSDYDPLVYLSGPNFKFESSDVTNDSIRALSLRSAAWNGITFKVNLVHTVKLYAICGICGYLLAGTLLIGFVVYISRDLNKNVIFPLESMFEKVSILSRDPMSATNDDFMNRAGIVSLLQSRTKTDEDELHLIDKSLMKVAYLLAVGFGDAGTGVIIKNMGKNKGLDTDIAGEKVIGIYGFCDIRNFTDATEVLQTKVMTFVNRIAAIVHINVVKFGGINNKNIGDAFLYVWKLASFSEAPAFAYRLQDYMRKRHELNDDEKSIIKMICDLSVYCIIKIISKINSYKQILHYRENKELNERIPDYAIKMGFGLHIGWAIEGLIGSSHKIDASYLSPHVNLAARLEAATKQFGVNFLLSEPLYNLLSDQFQAYCRCVDRCIPKGVAEPMRLYTFEVDVSNLPKTRDRFLKLDVKDRQRIANHEKNILFTKILNEEITTTELLEKDKEVRRLLHFHKMSSWEPFKKNYNRAFKNYLKGNWPKAHEYFGKCLLINPYDGPAKVIDEYIADNNFDSASVEWKGFRIL